MQHWLNWGRKEYMFQYLLNTIVLDFMGFPVLFCQYNIYWLDFEKLIVSALPNLTITVKFLTDRKRRLIFI